MTNSIPTFSKPLRIELLAFVNEDPLRPLDYRLADTRAEIENATLWSVIIIDEEAELTSLDCDVWEIDFTGEGALMRASEYADGLSLITAWPISEG